MLPIIISQKLRQLRYLLRTCVVIDGTASSITILCLIFWLDLTADRFLEPIVLIRAVILAAICVCFAVVLWKWLFFRLISPVSDKQLALLLEQHDPLLNESLITSVELADAEFTNAEFTPSKLNKVELVGVGAAAGAGHVGNVNAEMRQLNSGFIGRTVSQSAKLVDPINVYKLFNYKRLYIRTAAALLLLCTIIGFCTVFADSAEIWFSRNILLSERNWP
ncbi:MAG: hypothetical protein ACRC2T_15120, partial [Thermoguttaceae bacterium]